MTAKSARHVQTFSGREPNLARVIGAVTEQNLTFLSREGLVDLAEAVLGAERDGLPGAIVEAGTALGGSAITLARAKNQDRPMWVFDAFGLIPPPTAQDGADVHARYEEITSGSSSGIGGETYYGYRPDLLGEVTQSFRAFDVEPPSHSVTFVKGYYEDTMNVDFPIAVAHLDCDWYQSVMTCLEQMEPHLVSGGRFVLDDYYNWSGCTKAVDEFFAHRPSYRFLRKSRLHVLKE